MQGSAGATPAPPGGDAGPKGKALFQPAKKAEDDEEKRGPYIHLPRHGAAWILFVGSIFLFAALGAPWWSWSLSTTTQEASYWFFIWGVLCFGPSCPGASSTPLAVPTTPAFQVGSFFVNLSDLYATAAALSVVAVIFGIVAAAILFRVARGQSDYPKAVDRAVLLAYLAAALAFAIPVMVAVAQPSSMRADYNFPISLTPSPATSFYGSTGTYTFNHVAYTGMSWGPTYSWYLCVFAGLFFFGGGLAPHVTRHEPVTRADLIRKGLLKLQAPVQRPLPPGFRAPGLPAPAYAAAAPGRAYAPPGYRPQVYSSYGPGYQSLAPGVGWARPLPPGTGYPRQAPALPGAVPPAAGAPPGAVYRPAQPMAVSPASPPVYRPPQPAVAAPLRPSAPAAGGQPYRATPAPAYPATPSTAPASPAARPPPPKVPTSGNRVCTTCNTYVPPPALRCTKCGNLLPRGS